MSLFVYNRVKICYIFTYFLKFQLPVLLKEMYMVCQYTYKLPMLSRIAFGGLKDTISKLSKFISNQLNYHHHNQFRYNMFKRLQCLLISLSVGPLVYFIKVDYVNFKETLMMICESALAIVYITVVWCFLYFAKL